MKCEKCNENEANFFYSSTVNGQTTSYRLCADCAEKMGLLQPAANTAGSIMNSMFAGTPFGSLFGGTALGMPGSATFGGSALGAMLGGSALGSMMNSAFAPFGAVFGAPSFGAVWQGNLIPGGIADPTQGDPTAAKIPQEAPEEIKAKRELAELKARLDAAVKAEDFELAIKLRDEIKGKQ